MSDLFKTVITRLIYQYEMFYFDDMQL